MTIQNTLDPIVSLTVPCHESKNLPWQRVSASQVDRDIGIGGLKDLTDIVNSSPVNRPTKPLKYTIKLLLEVIYRY